MHHKLSTVFEELLNQMQQYLHTSEERPTDRRPELQLLHPSASLCMFNCLMCGLYLYLYTLSTLLSCTKHHFNHLILWESQYVLTVMYKMLCYKHCTNLPEWRIKVCICSSRTEMVPLLCDILFSSALFVGIDIVFPQQFGSLEIFSIWL